MDGYTAQQVKTLLGLIDHDEGGSFVQTYENASNGALLSTPDREGGSRPLMNTIYYMLDGKSPVGHLHTNQSDIVHYYHGGNPVQYIVVNPTTGQILTCVMGHDVALGHRLQLVVPGGWPKASRLLTKRGTPIVDSPESERIPSELNAFGLVSEVVVPGFDYRDRHLCSLPDVELRFGADASRQLSLLHCLHSSSSS
jgi:predicted cupin superfamily sugar epimerase